MWGLIYERESSYLSVDSFAVKIYELLDLFGL